jgi:hypothetical protein
MPAAWFRAVREPSAPSSCNLSPQRGRVDEVHEGPLAVDLDDRQPLAVPRFERVVARDVDLDEAVPELGTQNTTRLLAQMATLGGVERYGYMPRVTVASETR